MNIKQPIKISRNNNFDLLRFAFATSVFIWHVGMLTQNKSFLWMNQLIHPFSYIAVPGFFVISGFLIFMSYENSESLKSYFSKRIARIYPAYFFVVIFCAIVGCFFSQNSWSQYFISKDWITYVFYNLIFLNFLQPTLPGVFQNNFETAVNGSLWTIKIEIAFYLAVPVLVWFLRKYNKLVSLAIIYVLSYAYYQIVSSLAIATGYSFLTELARQLPGQLTYFASGALLYYYYDFFKQKSFWFLLFAVLIQTISYFARIDFFFPLCLAIFVIYVVFQTPYIDFFKKRGDFSYGIYIYHFPIVQVLIQYSLFETQPYLALFLTTLAITISSFCSWHWLEKRFLQSKKTVNSIKEIVVK
jgi:peptidoglycan/LPS O-acetylase OafA/YrhL